MSIPLNLGKDTEEGVHGDARFCSLRKLVTMTLEKALKNAKEGGVLFMGVEAK